MKAQIIFFLCPEEVTREFYIKNTCPKRFVKVRKAPVLGPFLDKVTDRRLQLY